jgi:arsenite methyltransferase
MNDATIKDTVKEKYAEAALKVLDGERGSCGPGGRFAVSDVVCRGEVPQAVRQSMELWVGCIAGALEEQEYRRLLAEAGFADVEVEPTRIYQFEDARAVLAGAGLDVDVVAREVSGRIMGAFIRARKR